MTTKKLYRVWLKGMTGTLFGTQTAYGCPYVVAESPNEAFEKVQQYLTKRDLGFTKDRVLDKIEYLAELADYPETGIQLFL